MKFCENCGKPMNEEDRFCEECGQVQEASAISTPPAAPAQQKSKAPLIIILVSAGVVTLVGVLVLVLWCLGIFGGEDESKMPSGGENAGMSQSTQVLSDGGDFTHEDLITKLNMFAADSGVKGVGEITSSTMEGGAKQYIFSFWDDLASVTLTEKDGSVVSVIFLTNTDEYPSEYQGVDAKVLGCELMGYSLALCEPHQDLAALMSWQSEVFTEEAEKYNYGVMETRYYSTATWTYTWLLGESSIMVQAIRNDYADDIVTTTTTQASVVIPGNDSFVQVPPTGEPHAGYSYRVKAGGGLYMRSGPAQSYSQIQLIPDGATVVIYYSQGEWWYGSYNNTLGWMNSGYLIVITEQVQTPAYGVDYYAYDYTGFYRVTSDNGINMRSGPGTEYSVVYTVPYYGSIQVFRRSGDWVYGCWYDSHDVPYGWVRLDNLVAIPE